jgi:hypothetical protein
VWFLETQSVPCLRRGAGNTMHIVLGPQNFWRVDVRPSDEARAWESLIAEIGREDEKLM